VRAKGKESEKGKGNGFHFICSSRLHQGRNRDKRDKKAPYKKSVSIFVCIRDEQTISSRVLYRSRLILYKFKVCLYYIFYFQNETRPRINCAMCGHLCRQYDEITCFISTSMGSSRS
jgi:hypothetical protein